VGGVLEPKHQLIAQRLTDGIDAHPNYWPQENRTVGENGKVGLSHVKCAVADGEWMFLSSANLTRQAFTINMELGMLVRGGSMPSRVERQFDQLAHDGHLKQI